MGIRETLNQRPAITTAATLAIIVVTLGVIVYQSWESGGATPPPSAKGWFTIDDGKNWFADEISKPSPYEYNGKQVYRVFVFTCDGGNTTFAGYLQRDLGKGDGVEVKAALTGDPGWIKRDDPKAAALIEPKCKDTNATATAVEP